MYRDEVGAELADNAHRFVSKLAADRYLGYLQGQKRAMTGQVGAHTNRPSWWRSTDTTPSTRCMPFGSGYRGSNCSPPAAITLPVPEPHREYLRSIRRARGRSPRSSTPSRRRRPS